GLGFQIPGQAFGFGPANLGGGRPLIAGGGGRGARPQAADPGLFGQGALGAAANIGGQVGAGVGGGLQSVLNILFGAGRSALGFNDGGAAPSAQQQPRSQQAQRFAGLGPGFFHTDPSTGEFVRDFRPDEVPEFAREAVLGRQQAPRQANADITPEQLLTELQTVPPLFQDFQRGQPRTAEQGRTIREIVDRLWAAGVPSEVWPRWVKDAAGRGLVNAVPPAPRQPISQQAIRQESQDLQDTRLAIEGIDFGSPHQGPLIPLSSKPMLSAVKRLRAMNLNLEEIAFIQSLPKNLPPDAILDFIETRRSFGR
ncbi:hypothetical protein LCGC14_2652330, partial [marine sediment metagenome]